jgi:hypothetical protein
MICIVSERTYDWQRFWHPKGVIPALGDEGFLSDPTTPWGAASNPALAQFREFADLPCLVLLGEPGTGKSRALDAERAAVEGPARAQGEEILAIDLRSIGTDTYLLSKVFGHPKFLAWAGGGGTPPRLHLFLDSLDECLLRVTTLAQILLDEFPQYPTDRLSLRIACRTAVWVGSLGFLEEGLRGIWGKDAVGVAELAPLRRSDVVHAAERGGVPDPEAFVQAVCRARAQAFAITPVTLNLLIRIFKEEGDLPGSLADLYRRGCRLLCEETNESRRASGARGSLSVDQRLAVAARVAAVTVFANRYAVFTRPDHGDVTGADVALASLVGGVEQDAFGTPFPVTDAAVSEALDTGLFSGRGSDRMGWAHQTYAEYLAALYVTDLHCMSGERLASLLVHPGDPEGRLAPQMHSVAAWIAPRNNDVLRHVTKSDPDVLLAGDAGSKLDVTTKALIVARLLEMVGENVLAVGDLPGDDRLRVLDYAGLPDQLRPLLADPAADPSMRYAAIDLGKACSRGELQDEWARIALDQSEPMLLRTHAAYAVARVGDAHTRRTLLPLAEGLAGDDPEDELKGCGLKAVWPEHISGTQLMALLTPPKNQDLHGAYWGFLHTLNFDTMSDADLPAALRWAATQRRADMSLDHQEQVVLAIMARAWDRMEVPGVLDALVDAALARIAEHEPLFKADFYGRVTPPDMRDDPKRRTLVEAIVARLAGSSGNNDAVLHLGMQDGGLFRADDLWWLLGCLRAVPPRSAYAQAYAGLIHFLFRWCDDLPEHFNAVYQATQWSPDLAVEYAHLFESVDLQSDRARHMKEQHNQMQALADRVKRPVLDPPPRERVLQHLTDFERGDDQAWVRLCRDLQLRPDSRRYDHDLEPDLTVLPGWKVADEGLRARIVDAAAAFLRRQPPGDLEWIGTSSLPFVPAAGYRALSLLLVQYPDALFDLPESVWRVWAPIIPAYPLANTGDGWARHRVLVTMAYDAEPGAVIQTLMRLIDKDSAGGHFLSEMDAFRACLDQRLSAALLAKVEEPTLSAAVTGTILDALMEHGQGEVPQAAQAAAERLLAALLEANVSGGPGAADKACMVAVRLVTRAPDASWDVVWPAVQADGAFGRAVFEAVAHQDHHGGRPFTILKERQLADLYLWLVAQYPYSADPMFQGAHFVGERESVAHWRDGLLNHLVARGTPEACAAVEQLVTALPHLTWMPQMLRQARDAMRRNTWQPPTPEQVIRLAAESDSRLVRTGGELLMAVAESLRRLQSRLQDETPAAFDLWSEIPGEEEDAAGGTGVASSISSGGGKVAKQQRRQPPPKTYRPKSENALSDYVKRHLEMDLRGRGIILGREVEIRPGTEGGAAGEVTDIHVDAVLARGDGRGDAPGDVASVIIETKGAWNNELHTALEGQLANRYLRASRNQHGVYLVGWYRCAQWDDRDWRRGKHPSGTANELRERLVRQASDVSQRSGTSIIAVVLDASLR